MIKVGDLVRDGGELPHLNTVGIVTMTRQGANSLKIAKVEWFNGSAGYYGFGMLKRVSK